MSLVLIDSCHNLSWEGEILKLYLWYKSGAPRKKDIHSRKLFFSASFPINALITCQCAVNCLLGCEPDVHVTVALYSNKPW